jgi:uncharacterized membrane protein YgaE (UPF0421/DUF939 family)
MSESYKNLLLYIAKCIAAASTIYFLSDLFHYSESVWSLISALLVLSPDDKEALPLAITRIQANLVGSGSVLLCLLLSGLPHIVTISLAYTLAITACFLLNLMTASRSALAAVTIIVLAPGTEAHLWEKPLERVLSVISGCVVGLVITLLIHRRFPGSKAADPGDHAE